MKRFFKNLIKNDHGVTLVELIVSLLILVIIFTPLFTTFITALKVNKRASLLTQAETVASNVMEEVNFWGYNGLFENSTQPDAVDTGKRVNKADAAYVVSCATTSFQPLNPSESVQEFINNRGADPIKEGSGQFDVSITFDREMESGAGAARNIVNEYKFADISDLNKNSTILINPETSGTNYDNVATDYFYTLHTNYADRGINANWATIRDHISKKMYLSIDRDTTYSEPYFIVNSSLEYTFTDDSSNLIDGVSETWSLSGYCDSVSFDELESVYLLYDPITPETVVMNAGVQGKQLLIQNGHEAVDIQTNNLVTVYDDISGTYVPAVNIYVIIQASADAKIEGTLGVTTNDRTKFGLKSQAGTTITSADGNNSATTKGAIGISKAQAIDRIYEVTVKVYNHEDGTELTSITSTVNK